MPYMMPCSTFDPPTHYSIYCYTHTQIYIYTVLTTTYGSIFNSFPHFARVDTVRKVTAVTSNSLPSPRRSHRDHCHPGQPYHLPSIYMEVRSYLVVTYFSFFKLWFTLRASARAVAPSDSCNSRL